MSVNDSNAVMDDAFDRLGYPDVTGTISLDEPDDYDYTMLNGYTTADNPHWVLGDEDANMIWDPLNSNNGVTDVFDTRYLTINDPDNCND